jgi:hypothetical protein
MVLKSAFSELHQPLDKKDVSSLVELNLVGQVGTSGREKLRITLLCVDASIKRDRHFLEQVDVKRLS